MAKETKLQRWQRAREKRAFLMGKSLCSVWAADGTPLMLVQDANWYEWGITIYGKEKSLQFIERVLNEKAILYTRKRTRIHVHAPEIALEKALEGTIVKLDWGRREPKEVSSVAGKPCLNCGQIIQYNGPRWGYACRKCGVQYCHACVGDRRCRKCGSDINYH